MRKTLIALALLTLGCSDSTGVPASLPVTLDFSVVQTPSDTTVVGAGDSVVVTTTVPLLCTASRVPRAGMRGGMLVVTVTDSTDFLLPCALVSGYGHLVATVHRAPAGRYPVEVDLRHYVVGKTTSEVLVRAEVRLP